MFVEVCPSYHAWDLTCDKRPEWRIPLPIVNKDHYDYLERDFVRAMV